MSRDLVSWPSFQDLAADDNRQVIEHLEHSQQPPLSQSPPPVTGTTSSRLHTNGVTINANGQVDDARGLDYVTLASTTEGYSISDLRDLTHAATQQAIIRSTKDDTLDVGLPA